MPIAPCADHLSLSCGEVRLGVALALFAIAGVIFLPDQVLLGSGRVGEDVRYAAASASACFYWFLIAVTLCSVGVSIAPHPL
jgi:hypothetical protein